MGGEARGPLPRPVRYLKIGWLCFWIGLATLLVMVVPLTIIVEFTEWGLFACWINLTFYVMSLFSVTLWRYRQGKWKKIRVI